MSTRLKIIYRFGAAVILLLLACLLVYAYGSQHTVPSGVKLSDWSPEGISLSQLDLDVKNVQKLIQQQPILFKCIGVGCEPALSKSDPFRQSYWSSASLTFEDLGAQSNLLSIT